MGRPRGFVEFMGKDEVAGEGGGGVLGWVVRQLPWWDRRARLMNA